ncbi:hypothetical protein [Paraburkholderia bannensis]|uniref:hypothetical protein n=1 Tax=Paraburkholderia bannensis TaxID=765414 RepID=UPI002AB5FBA7|nr:hypothetical protein [Paraburkholderia bannensis]
MRIVCTAALLALAVSLPARAATSATPATPDTQSSTTWLGTLGKSAIAVRLYRNDDGQTVGTYFYRSQGVDIGLVAQGKPGQFVECPLRGGNDQPAACDAPTGYWSIALNGDSASGTWRKTPQAAPLPVALSRSTASCDNIFRTDKQQHAYECLRADAPLRATGKQSISHDGTLAWQFVEENRSGASAPQLTRAPNPAAMAAINRDLQKVLRSDINAALEAKPEGQGSCATSIALANQRWFVVERGCEWDWPGAAHPSSSWESTTYDVTSGNAVSWPAIVRLPDPAGSTFDYSKGRDIVSLALRHAAAKRTSASNDNGDSDCAQLSLQSFDCKGTVCDNKDHDMKPSERGWEVELSPHENGLFASFNTYAEVDRQCRGEGVTLPWSEVRPLLLAPRSFP